MGVPKFYRWISERYPCLSEVVREYQIPEFDNLYLDMNGIIHVCSHPNDEDPHFRISEEKIFKDIFQYIEALFRLIRPRKVFFMAVDGVAPRAKMNQQRGRRFRSAREAEELERRALKKGEVLPQEERFDSNCITPGTAFMARLHEHLKYFVTMKISTDKLWRGIRIYLSGHETPGEGEHKIMEFIRSEKSKPGYNPNTRHCLYGLDADLIMLGLCTHEPHFSLLREEVQFGGKKSQKRMASAQETTFHLLHLSLMREYLDFEFSSLKNRLSFEYDLEKIIDDWVLMGFLVGNDFIPHLPQMHIAHDALPLLYNAYKEVLPKLDGYINEGGYLNISRFEIYLQRVALIDYEYFNDNYTALAWFNSKTGRKTNASNECGESRAKKKFKMTANVFDVLSNVEDGKTHDVDFSDCTAEVLFDNNKEETAGDLAKIASSDEEEENEEEERDTFEMEFRQHKRDYYMNKLEYPAVTSEILQDQAECYVRAIQWNLHYYYNGVCSWSWFYPHHYAPYISDIKNFTFTKVEFDMGKPFLPFEQLLAVLPAASKKLLPASYQSLMITENSPLIDYYPLDFKTDLNGKLQEWEAVVLIPFINENRLLEAIAPLEMQLTNEERRRNKHGSCLLYTISEETLPVPSFDLHKVFPEININFANCAEVSVDEFNVEKRKLRKGLCENVRLDVYFPGFPTLKHIPHSHELKKASVKVFQMPSRNENMLLHVKKNKESCTVHEVAENLLSRNIFVSWPHLVEAKVVAVSDQCTKISLVEARDSKRCAAGFNYDELSENERSTWKLQCESITERCFDRFGIVVGSIDILIFACPLAGRKYVCSANGRVTLEKQWTAAPIIYAHQLTVVDIATHDPSFKQFKSIEDLFKPKSSCFMLGHPHYGSFGHVIEANRKNKGQVTIELTVLEEPDLEPIIKKQHMYSVSYMPGYVVAQRLGISSHLLSRMTGTLFVSPGSRGHSSSQRINVGLNLKFNKRNKEVPGYTKKCNDGWLYSGRALDVMAEYIKKFPELFEFLARNVQEGSCYSSDIFTKEDGTAKLQEIQAWLKSLPCSSIEQKVCGTEVLDEPIIRAIEEAVDKAKNSDEKRQLVVHTKPSNVFLPQEGSLIPDSSVSFRLFDRVINVREGFSVPLGLRGTITGIHLAENQADTLYDIVFDEEFLGGIALRCSASKGCKMSAFALINLSHGARCENQRRKSNPKFKSTTRTDVSNSHALSRPQLNTINHSPNSPFVPQQTQNEPANDNRESQQMDVDTTTDEFVKTWQQLQSNAGYAKIQQKKTSGAQSVSLQKAARKLPQRVTMQTFNRSAQASNTSSNSPGKSTAVSEFGGFLQTLEASKSNNQRTDSNVDKFSVDGTAALIQMLHIGNSEKRDKLARQSENENNLQELKRTSFAKTKPVSTNLTSNVAYSQQHQSCGLTPSYELLNLVQRLFGTLPLYHYTQGGLPHQQYFLAQVTLPNGLAYHSVPCTSKREACDSAAMFALEYLRTQIQIPPQTWRMAPVIQPAIQQGYNCHIPFDPCVNIRSLAVGNASYPHPWGLPPFAHASSSVRGNVMSPLTQLEQSNRDVAFAMNNRFVPMQVTLNNRATKKDSWSSGNQSCDQNVGQAEHGKMARIARSPPKKSRHSRLAARFDYCS